MMENNSVSELEFNMEHNEKFRSLIYGMYMNTQMTPGSILVITHRYFSPVRCQFEVAVMPLSHFGEEVENYRSEMTKMVMDGCYPALLVSDDANDPKHVNETFIGLPKITSLS